MCAWMLLGWPHLQGWGRLFFMGRWKPAQAERFRFDAGIVLDLWRNVPCVLCTLQIAVVFPGDCQDVCDETVFMLEEGYRTKLVLFALVANHLQEEKLTLRAYFSFSAAWLLAGLAVFPLSSQAQESPYIVTYNHYLEEPGNLEIEYFSAFGTQRSGNNFHAFWTELEYGATAWWTTELYLDGQTTFRDSTVFTGLRFENRIPSRLKRSSIS